MNRVFCLIFVVASLILLAQIGAHAQWPAVIVDNGSEAAAHYEGGVVGWTTTGVQHILITPSAGGPSLVMDDPGGSGPWTTISGGLGIGGGASADTLSVSGATTLDGLLTANGGIAIVGATEADTVIVGGATDTAAALDAAGGAVISGGATLNDGATVNGLATLNNGALVNGGATLNDGAAVNGGATVNNGATIYSGAGTGSRMIVSDTGASLQLSTAGGMHGILITPTQTVLSGGSSSTELILDDGGATFADEDTGSPVTVTGVADGVAPYDAVNVRQLNDQLGGLESTLSSGIASVAALAAIPDPVAGRNCSVGVGVGHYNHEGALAVGLKGISGDFSFTAGMGFTKQHNTASIGMGISF